MAFRMNVIVLAAIAAHGAAWAQGTGSVQLYGQITAAVSYKNHQTGASSLKEVNNSALAASLFGLRGTEDLGGGMSAIFRLESGIGSDTGSAGATVAGANKFWNRQSFVGLNFGPVATVTLGRQFHASTDRVIQSLDVYNVGGTSLTVTPFGLFGVNRFSGNDSRADDSVKLRLRGPAGLTAGLSAAADDGAGRSWSFDVAQVTPAYTIAAYAVEFKSPIITANRTRPANLVWGLGGNVPVGPVKLYVHYMDSKLDPSAVGRIEQANKILSLGLNWQVNAPTVIKAAWYHDKGTAVGGFSGRNGNKDTWVVSAEYYLSKRTSLHVAASSNRFTDGYKLDATNIAALNRDPAASSTQSLTAGMRHDF